MREHHLDSSVPPSPTRVVLFDDAYEAGELLGTRLASLPVGI